MKLSAKELENITGGKLTKECNIEITGAAGLLEASEFDISFLGNLKYQHLLNQSKAGIILIPENMPDTPKPAIKVKNPQFAFAKNINSN